MAVSVKVIAAFEGFRAALARVGEAMERFRVAYWSATFGVPTQDEYLACQAFIADGGIPEEIFEIEEFFGICPDCEDA